MIAITTNNSTRVNPRRFYITQPFNVRMMGTTKPPNLAKTRKCNRSPDARSGAPQTQKRFGSSRRYVSERVPQRFCLSPRAILVYSNSLLQFGKRFDAQNQKKIFKKIIFQRNFFQNPEVFLFFSLLRPHPTPRNAKRRNENFVSALFYFRSTRTLPITGRN